MWKYINTKQCNEFLLSLQLINCNNNNNYIKKIYSISQNKENNYTKHKIKKKNGKDRIIYEPNPTLKHIQRQILNNILNNKEISKYATAYKKNISLKNNAIPHINKKMILKLDIKDFFHNIKFINIYNSCFPIEYFPKSIGMLLTHLCTYEDYLPQGAPTSAYISNLVMKNFDNELGTWCEKQKISYTRYSDDMTFSGEFIPNIIISKVRKMLYKLDLELNNEKIHVLSNSTSQIVTGITVNKKIQTNIKYRKKIRQELYYIKKYGLNSHLKHTNIKLNKQQYLNSLYGKILFILQINNQDIEFIKYKFFLKELIVKEKTNP